MHADVTVGTPAARRGETCFVTAFKDIGRKSWSTFHRSNEEYLRCFRLLCEMKVPLVVYIDAGLAGAVAEITAQARPPGWLTRIIPIDDAFLDAHVEAWSYRETERAIMASRAYRAVVARRRENPPEVRIPEYNCINHAKIDFRAHAIRNGYGAAEYYGWIDFGYCKTTASLTADRTFLPIPALLDDKVNLVAIDAIQEADRDPIALLASGAVRVTGPFFHGRADVLLAYRDAYHEVLREGHRRGVADDDQNAMVQVCLARPELVRVWHNDLTHPAGWFNCFPKFHHDLAGFADRADFKHAWMGLTGTFVEVGVFRGDHSAFVLANSTFATVCGVDAYRRFADVEYKDAINTLTQGELDQIHARAAARFAGEPRYRLIRRTSREAADEFAPGSVDAVYIDANHGYAAVLEDMEIWWSRVKSTGVLAGDDLVDDLDAAYDADNNQRVVWGPGCWGHYGVNRALRSFEQRHGVRAHRLPGRQWMIRKSDAPLC
jgi:hypothetical protein